MRDARERDLTRIAWDAVVGVTSATSVGPPRFLQSGEAGLVTDSTHVGVMIGRSSWRAFRCHAEPACPKHLTGAAHSGGHPTVWL